MRTCWVCFWMACAFTGTVRAQAVSSDVAQARIEVVEALSITASRGVDFGLVAAGAGSVEMDREGNIITGASTGTTSSGKFEVQGAQRRDVYLSYTAQVVLAGSGGSQILYEPALFGDARDDAARASAISGSEFRLGNDGRYYFFVGGAIHVGTGVQNGVHTGSFTLTVDYVGL